MPQADLFDKTADFNREVCRNIVSLRESVDLFDDLSGENPELSTVALEAEMRVKRNLAPGPAGIIFRGFHYSTAITYPFEVEPFLSTRYGDGTHGVWYGSLDLKTTIYETVFHMIKAELAVEGIEETIIRERAVYDVHCKAILLDLRDKRKSHPRLIGEDYDFTQQIGRRLFREGHPGLLAPSARCSGDNLTVFSAQVLSNPRLRCYLTYYFNPLNLSVRIERQTSKRLMVIDGRRWFNHNKKRGFSEEDLGV